jgi:hypothetical protein
MIMKKAMELVYNFINSNIGIEGCRNWHFVAWKYADYFCVPVENSIDWDNWALCLPNSEMVDKADLSAAVNMIASKAGIGGKLGFELPVLRAILRTRKLGVTSLTAKQIGWMWDIPEWKARYVLTQL